MSPVDAPLAVLAVAFAVTLLRIVVGPSLADRVIAAELAFAVLLGAIALLAVRLGSTPVLDVAAIAALLQFITTAALAYLLQRTPASTEEPE